ncbi:MAG TPA: hypothetical protein VMU69_15410 [Bradyrhizobium sp.]|nr:hypothetical protein [Bradyrhizobium sp.]
MNTARIVVLTIAVGAIGAAACSARGADSNNPLPAEPAARLLDGPRPDSGPLSPAPSRFTVPDIIQSSAREGRSFRRGGDIKVATQK